MEIPNHIKDSVLNTVGYSEALNKNSFVVGAQVAFDKAEDYYTPLLDSLTKRIAKLYAEKDEAIKELTTVSNILTKYSDK